MYSEQFSQAPPSGGEALLWLLGMMGRNRKREREEGVGERAESNPNVITVRFWGSISHLNEYRIEIPDLPLHSLKQNTQKQALFYLAYIHPALCTVFSASYCANSSWKSHFIHLCCLCPALVPHTLAASIAKFPSHALIQHLPCIYTADISFSDVAQWTQIKHWQLLCKKPPCIYPASIQV